MTPANTPLSQKFAVVKWAYGTAWRIDPKPMLLWHIISAVLAVLPSIALRYNRQTLSVLSGFLSGQPFVVGDAIQPIVALGALMVLIGLSARINANLIYMMMYETYYSGTQELLMDSVQEVPMTELLKKDINDAFNFSILRAGSLTDLISGSCALVSKFVGIASLLIVSWGLSKFIFTISLVYSIAVIIINFHFTKNTREDIGNNFYESRLASYFENLYDNKGIAKEVRLYENTEHIINSWKGPFAEFQNIERRRVRSSETRDFVIGASFYIFLALVLSKSLYDVSSHNLSPAVFLLLFALCSNLYSTISGAAGNISSFDSGLVALEFQYKFFSLIPKTKEPPPNRDEADTGSAAAYKADNLTFSYPDGKPAIDNISFEIKQGETVALVGQNGSGKSTLVKLLANMYRPASGSIMLYGKDISGYSQSFLRAHISVFFQNFYIFHQTLRENVAAGNIDEIGNDGMILAALKKGGGDKVLAKLGGGLDTLLGKFMDKSGTELSGGEKQRVGVSRTHMSDRQILIFDEPASMIDPIAEAEQFQNIKDMLGGRTAILISHRVGFARMADKIIMLEDGRIAETGTHDELMRANGTYAHFFNEQSQWYTKN
jgi:ATP-binding cassette subfamily B protein